MIRTARPARKASNAYHHGGLREALIRAAMNEVDRNGPESVTLSALAKVLGVSQAAPYRHFADRDELLAAVTTEGFRAFCAAQREALDQRSPRSRLLRVARAYLAFGRKHVGVYRLMFASRVMPQAEAGSELQVAALQSFELLLEALDPSLDEATRRRFALKCWSTMHGVVTLADQGLLPGPGGDVSVDELVDDFVRDTERAMAAARAAG